MVTGISNAVKEALNEIQKVGYSIACSPDQDKIYITWIGSPPPPDISRQLAILQTNPNLLGEALRFHTVSIPLWLILGYPWDRPREHWSRLEKSLSSNPHPFERKKHAYAKACLECYKSKRDTSWKEVMWEEPWPVPT